MNSYERALKKICNYNKYNKSCTMYEVNIIKKMPSVNGTFNSYEEFIKKHPTGSKGEVFLVDEDIYVWDDEKSKWTNAGRMGGTKGEKGDKGDKGDAGPERVKTAYIVTFNSIEDNSGIKVPSNTEIPLERVELNPYDIISLNSNKIKFNLIGYYKISFTISALIKKDSFAPSKDIISVGIRPVNTDNIYIGVSKWNENNTPEVITTEGMLVINNTSLEYALINLSPSEIILNSPDLKNLKTNSYFSNSVVTMIIEYLGT